MSIGTVRIAPGSTGIPFAAELVLPLDVVTQKLACLGISGSGKTYGAGVLVEGIFGAGAQVVVVDTVGNWWGLRLGADGKREGLAFPILGGDRGDVALEPGHGKLAAEVVTESRASMVLDVSDFTSGELRAFVVDFATNLLRLKKRSPSPVMIVWEECQDIVPQRVYSETARMVGAVERLVKRGRNYGVGTLLISQRPAAVNKDVLSQVETMLAFRTGGAQDRDAIGDWMKAKSLRVDLADLPELPTGTCFCWSPQWLGIAQKIRVGKKRTFNATRTPEIGDHAAGELAPVDLERFKEKMGAAIAKAKAEDPAELRRRIADLEAQLKRAATPAAAAPDRTQVAVRAYDAGFEQGWKESAEVARSRLASAFDQPFQAIRGNAEQATLWPPPGPGKQRGGRSIPLDVFGPETAPPRLQRPQAAGGGGQDQRPPPPPDKREHHFAAASTIAGRKVTELIDHLSPCGKKILFAISLLRPEAITHRQIATIAGYSHRSGTFAAGLAAVRAASLVTETSDGMVLAPSAAPFFDGTPTLSSGAALIAMWRDKLPGRCGEMLQRVVDAGDAGVALQDLADQLGMSGRSGTFAAYLATLRGTGLAEGRRGMLRASEILRRGA